MTAKEALKRQHAYLTGQPAPEHEQAPEPESDNEFQSDPVVDNTIVDDSVMNIYQPVVPHELKHGHDELNHVKHTKKGKKK